MGTTARNCVYLVTVLAVFRVTTAGQQAHKGFNHALRIQAAVSKGAESPTKDAKPTAESQNKTADAGGINIKDAASWTPPPHKNIFKMPKMHHADSLSAATNGFLDWFVLGYWGVVVLAIVSAEVSLRDRTEPKESSPSSPEEGQARMRVGRTVSFLAGDEVSAAELLGEAQDKVLSPNVWSLSLVAARGLAKDRKGNILSPKLVFVAGVAMGLIQLLTLFLVVYDIDPSASPYTQKPGAPWKESPLTVNCMKVVMVFFLGMYVVSEAADAYDNFVLGVAMKDKGLLIHWSFVLFIPVFHYLITLSVILAGVSVVLSCQDVPNILYNSMAILFITRVDELFWGFFERTFDIEAEWTVQMNQSDVAEVQLIKKCIIMFPMLWGFCLLGRAWYTDQMPALVVRVVASAAGQST